MPEIELRPIDLANPPSPSRALVTLPVELVVPAPQAGQHGLVAATYFARSPRGWVCCWPRWPLPACCFGVIQLSERRGEFVSAVTHELRTPLTTFRMYAEMLAEGMVPAETREAIPRDACAARPIVFRTSSRMCSPTPGSNGAASQKPTAETTCGELIQRNDRPAHRPGGRSRLYAHGRLCPEEAAAAQLTTDAAAVEQILFNLVDNACKYAQGGGESQNSRTHRGRHGTPSSSSACAITAAASKQPIRAGCSSRSINHARRRRLPRRASVWGLHFRDGLAGQLGGKLELDRHVQSGARFTLSLPRASS